MADTSSWRSWPTTERVTVARVASAKGLRGALKIEVLTDDPERFALGAALRVEGEADARTVTGVEGGARPRVIALSGIDTRERAERLVGRYLEAERRALPAGTWYWHELEGLTVTDTAGTRIGRLAEVFRAGGAEVYRVERDGTEDLLVPALQRFIVEIDPPGGRIVLTPDALEEPD